jgi:outer membrane receptor protein involved in Fe transport
MTSVRPALVLAAALAMPALVGRTASAQQPPPPQPVAEPDAVEAEGVLSATDEELLRMAEEGEVIVVWAERPNKPFDRDTRVRLTGEELAARGATDLATALALLPDVSVRDVGRGGFNIDIRGARKGAVRVLVDGVSVSDPYYGTFDVSTIPVTDIVEIRVSTAPASPIDGPGGPGGVIEVHTRDAIGARLIVGRVTSDTMPTLGASATGRAPLADHLALRLSLSSLFGMTEYDTPADGVTIDEQRRAATGTFRLEYRDGARRAVVDGFADTRRYVSPPSDELATALVLLIDRETTGRISVAVDDELGSDPALQIQAQSWLHATSRVSRNFRDFELDDEANSEDLTSVRAGGMALATRPIGLHWRWVASAHLDHERATVKNRNMMTGATTVTEGDATLTETAAGAQFEHGPVRVDGAAGLAAPIGLGASPWPEAKLAAKYRPFAPLELEAIGARKGRVPSLRERYEGIDGNMSLDPEMAWHGEVRVTGHPVEDVDLVAAPYYRKTTGTVKLDPDDGIGLINLGELHVRGVDLDARARLHRTVEVGADYQYARARSDDLGPDPLDRFPRHRADGWVRATPLAWMMAMARARYVGRALDKGMTTPAYVLWDATVTGNLRGDWIGVVRVDDILDVRPESRAGYHLPGRVISLAVQGTWD